VEDARGMSEEEIGDRIVIGKLAERKRAEYTEGLLALNRRRREELEAALAGEGAS
jgi:hypothetical protein